MGGWMGAAGKGGSKQIQSDGGTRA